MQESREGRTKSQESVAKPFPPYPRQRQEHPGLEAEMDPRPQFRAEEYKAAGKLEGKVALITGGDSGIGRAVALLYAREGADVAIVYLPSEQADAEETCREVEAQGRACLLLPGDLREASFCVQTVERTVQEFGRLNILVSNAAHLNSKLDMSELTYEDWDQTFRVNIYSYFHLVMAADPHLGEGDAIIATSSEEGLKGSNTMIDYAASKAAQINFTKSIAPHMAKKGVRANVVAPGPTWTSLNVVDRNMPMEGLAHLGQEGPMERVAQPSEIAPAYVYLASAADAGYVVGEVVAVTGGIANTR